MGDREKQNRQQRWVTDRIEEIDGERAASSCDFENIRIVT